MILAHYLYMQILGGTVTISCRWLLCFPFISFLVQASGKVASREVYIRQCRQFHIMTPNSLISHPEPNTTFTPEESVATPTTRTANSTQITPLEEEVLTVISAYKETYGFQIINTFEKASGGKWKPSIGTLYPLLDRLQKKGLVESRMADESDPTGGARRKYFSLTRKGNLALLEAQQFRDNLYRCALAGV